MMNPPLLHVALWEPEIPPNTGNIARLCAAAGVRLHLVGRLGFRIDDRSMKRAGLDYWEFVDWKRHDDFAELEADVGVENIIVIETPAKLVYTEAPIAWGTCLLFGNESRGLPETIRARYADRLYGIPMLTTHVRSLNLANAVSIVLYDALRRLHGW